MDSDSEGDRGETAGEQTRPRPREVSGSTIERAHSGGTRTAGGKPGAIGLPRLVGRLDLAPSAAEPRVAERNRRRMLETILSYPPVKGASGLSPSLIAAGDTHAPRTRSLRFLAARLIQEAATSHNLCFSIAAPHRYVGASFMASNLAIVFSQIGLRTVLVDANIAAPTMHNLFDCPNDRGVGDLTSGDTLDTYPIKRLPHFQSLSLVTAGTPAKHRRDARITSELDRMVSDLRKAYEVVICDAPAYAKRGERACEAVAGICGDSLMVLREDRTPVRLARRLREALAAAKIHIVGSVLLQN